MERADQARYPAAARRGGTPLPGPREGNGATMAWQQARTLYFTGKGGAGKSFVSSRLAREAARRGVNTAVVELVDDHRKTRSDAIARSAWIHPRVVDQAVALEHLLTRLVRLRFVSRRLLDSRTFSALAAAAPGVRDLAYLCYVYDLAAGRLERAFDLVLVNGLASGHSGALLETPARLSDLSLLGPAAHVVGAVGDWIADGSRFRVAIVTLAEELGVNETEELHQRLAQANVTVAPTVVNGVYPPRLTEEQLAWVRERKASSDAELYMRRRARQLRLAEQAVSPGGPIARTPYCFAPSPVESRAYRDVFDRLASEWT